MGSSVKDRDGESISASAISASVADDPHRERKSRTSKSGDKPRDKERHRERSDKDKDGDDKDRSHRHKSDRPRKHKSRRDPTEDGEDGVSQTSSHRRHRTKEEKQRERERKTASMSDLTPESLLGGSRISLPYPSFSKAHSKENVGSVTDLSAATQRTKPLTPDATATDLGDRKRSKSADTTTTTPDEKRSSRNSRPPSPPETDLSNDKRFSKASTLSPKGEPGSDSLDRPRSRTSDLSRSASKRDDRSKLSSKSRASSQATYVRSSADHPPPPPPPFGVTIVDDEDSTLSDDRTAGARSAATSVLPKRNSSSRKSSRLANYVEVVDDSPDSVQDSSPRTPTVHPAFPPPPPPPFMGGKPSATPEVYYEDEHDRPTPTATPMTDFGPPPPPPPPPPLTIQEIPRVDYLLQHGGLTHPVSKNFLAAIPRQNGTRPSNPPLVGADTLFAPLYNMLDQYQAVLNKQGSVAVATGHKSVARRLLDRLEDVFSRDLPADGCSCIMCEKYPDEHRGLGWGEVLERVGGRVELPSWPPFDLASMTANAIEDSAAIPPRPSSPIKLDPDIAEEFRDHYLRQSRKVKSAVDKWMNNCADAPAPAPSEVDDETLSFAILTSLTQEEKPYFLALISGARELQPSVRAPTPMRKPRTDFMVKTGLSLQRLYRLPQPPRDAETAVYLVRNPTHHDLLSTMTDISPQEWEILISGRFDGFLWSGADADELLTPTAENPSRGTTPANGFFSPPPSRGPMTPGRGMRGTPGFGASRNTTPFSGMYSRGTTPASFVSLSSSVGPGQSRHAVSHDEEMEMAVLAEVEREIYQGMEALEDAFERLHHRAEIVRNALRTRNTGLLTSQQHRRAGRIDVLPQLSGDSYSSDYQRPPWALGDEDGITSESDWGGDDFDLKPEDSASNISSNRHRRPKRRTERRTPAPIEEDDEEN
ncbi:uncharacterized protein B0I36DRAFT_325811 [Microdochium trichocladiopsis]|uniref:5-Methylcytosine G/T mismatch-specific DNA glycosylase n=1 Tax=Microdochium trichocladiopsis TaxID=1682393 RepID=A0A9P8Y797_9PEZI|nr:uncharacterized protein B0I36DRAFT_325811 [Microdochium trichocladiopsis]KAH7029451.1 hypothetical protein B0I36DRAFT_325811 [Microdochium trichocladiopsis]